MRTSCRAIIIKNGKLAVMFRKRDERVYYTFPGGGQQENETLEECAVREVFEEFGIVIEIVREVYAYTDKISKQHFFLANWKSGKFGSGVGEEFQPGRNSGIYKPMKLDMQQLENFPLFPVEVKAQLLKDFRKNGEALRKTVKKIKGEYG